MAPEVFRWVDDKGVTHYGEEPPEGVRPERAFTMPDAARVSNPEDDYFSVVNQSRRMEESRLAREKARDERIAEQRASQPGQPANVYIQNDGYARGFGYAYPPYVYPRPPIHGKPSRSAGADCRTTYIGCPKYLPPNPDSVRHYRNNAGRGSSKRSAIRASQPSLGRVR